jgi:hypothetical protein
MLVGRQMDYHCRCRLISKFCIENLSCVQHSKSDGKSEVNPTTEVKQDHNANQWMEHSGRSLRLKPQLKKNMDRTDPIATMIPSDRNNKKRED